MMAAEIINDGGPAFPVDRMTAHGIAVHSVGTKDEAAYIGEVAKLSHGMTLRDHFAGLAMQAELSSAGMDNEAAQALADAAERAGRDVESQIAWNAYAVADAMLKERAR